MGLKLKELQKVVKSVVREERNIEILRGEVVRVLGPTILTSHGLERMMESANERIDILEATGRTVEQIKPSLLLKFVDSESVEARKFVARMLPESFIKMMVKDSSPAVRATVAARLPLNLVTEMVRRFPLDDTLRTIEKAKKLTEAGLPAPEVADAPFDMYGDESLSDMIGKDDSNEQHPGLTDTWYKTLALKIVNMYGRNVEEQWEEDTVHRYVDSMESMGTKVDRKKLLQMVYDLLYARDEAVLKEHSLKELAAKLRYEDTAVMPIISEAVDPVEEILTSRSSINEYIEKFEQVFEVQTSTSINPAYHRGIMEGSENIVHPSAAKLPGRYATANDERALDSYVKAWNTKEQLRGEAPYTLAWSPDPEVINMVNFHLELK